MWQKIKGFFSSFGSVLKQGFVYAQDKGLTDEVTKQALLWVRVAATKYTDDAQKREWVVGILVAKGIPEGVARVAVELALAFAKKELGV